MKARQQTLETDLLDLQDNMLHFAMTLTANKEQAKDLTQEATLKVLSNLDKYYNNVNFKGWVFTIMRNLFVNNYRRIVRSQTIVDQTDNLYLLNQFQNSGFDSPEGAYSYSEILKTIDDFTTEYRRPFLMHVSGYRYDEIAKDMKLPLGTIKSRIFFARKRLQAILRDYK